MPPTDEEIAASEPCTCSHCRKLAAAGPVIGSVRPAEHIGAIDPADFRRWVAEQVALPQNQVAETTGFTSAELTSAMQEFRAMLEAWAAETPTPETWRAMGEATEWPQPPAFPARALRTGPWTIAALVE